MDISSYINELLFEHDCVIVPGFGGFICNYQPAEIHPILHTISPPAKKVAFNRNLQANDGLLVNYIALAEDMSYDSAYELVQTWVSATSYMLAKNKELLLSNIGTLQNNHENNLQFEPTGDINYLKSSFGLKTITAEPVLRKKQIEFTGKFSQETKKPITPKRVWNIAATVLLVVCLVVFAELIWMGFTVRPFSSEEANVLSSMTNIFSPTKTVSSHVPTIPAPTSEVVAPAITDEQANIDKKQTETVATENVGITTSVEHHVELPVYYIVVGVFAEEKNITSTRNRLQEQFPQATILQEKTNRLTKLGYSVGSDYAHAQLELGTARNENPAYWLYKK